MTFIHINTYINRIILNGNQNFKLLHKLVHKLQNCFIEIKYVRSSSNNNNKLIYNKQKTDYYNYYENTLKQ